jgi:hypothetical protein
MEDCAERKRISREIAVTIRDLLRVKRERTAQERDSSKIDTFFLLSHQLARLRTEYQRHVDSHMCVGPRRATDLPVEAERPA